jgi:beta-glucosidase
LPLNPNIKVLVAGDAADNIGKQSGGWTITWQGTDNKNSDFPGASSIYSGIEQLVTQGGGQAILSATGEFNPEQKPDVAIVVFGEEPYAEGNGDIDNLEYQRGDKRDLALLKTLKAQGIPVVSVFISGRPMWVNPELNQSDAFVAAWLPGSEGQGIADVLFTKPDGSVAYDFVGKLSFSWPSTPQQTQVNVPLAHDKSAQAQADYQPLIPYGYGITYQSALTDAITLDKLSEDSVAASQTLDDLALFERAVKSPWSMYIASKGDWQTLSSSVAENSALKIRTMDRQVQEDARLVKFNGTELGTVGLVSNFPRDFRAYSDADSALSLSIKVDSALNQPLWLGMACEGDCRAQYDISKQVTVGEWNNVSVALNCFAQESMDFGKMVSPFYLATDAKVQLSFSDVLIQANHQAHTIQCN